jgi:hypothetical protein
MFGQSDNTAKDLEAAPVYKFGTEGDVSQLQTHPVNSLLNPSYARKIGNEIYHSSTDWLNASRRSKWSDSLRAFQGQHPNGSKYLSEDYKYRSRLFRPKTRGIVRKAEANTAAAFFSNEDVVSITAQDGNDPMQQASAEIMQALLQYRLTKTIPWFLTLVGARQDAEVMGICIGKAYWKFREKVVRTEARPVLDQTGFPIMDETGEPIIELVDISEKLEDKPWIDLVAPENFRFDPGADWRNPISTSPYLIELIPMYVADVQLRIESGEWLNISPSALHNATSLDDDSTRNSREQGRVSGKSATISRPGPFDICWVRENIVRQGDEEVHFYSLNGSGELLTNPKPLSEIYLQGIRPYVCGFILPEAHKTYPSGKVELVRDLQTKANDIDNLRLDNVKLALNPRQFVSAGYGFDINDLQRFKPGKVVMSNGRVNMGEVISWDRPPEVTAGAYAEQDRTDMDFDDLVGGLSHATINANKGVFDAQGNTELLDSSASKLEEYEQRVFAETFVEPLLRHLVKLEQAYETDPVVLALAGQEAQLWQKFGINAITDTLLQQELTIKVNVGIGATNPKQKLQNFLTATTAVGKLYGPVAAMGSNPEEVIKEIFGLCGYKDGERFFQKGFNMQQAMQMMASGKDKGSDKAAEQQAEAARQREQDILDSQKMKIQHEYKMQELQLQNEAKQKELGAKMWLEMQKIQSNAAKENQQMQQMTRMTEMTRQPPATIQFNAEEALGRTASTVEKMMHGQNTALAALERILMPMSQAASAMSEVAQATYLQSQQSATMMKEMLDQTSQGQEVLAGAIDRLTKAQLAPRRGRRAEDGSLISEAVLGE